MHAVMLYMCAHSRFQQTRFVIFLHKLDHAGTEVETGHGFFFFFFFNGLLSRTNELLFQSCEKEKKRLTISLSQYNKDCFLNFCFRGIIFKSDDCAG